MSSLSKANNKFGIIHSYMYLQVEEREIRGAVLAYTTPYNKFLEGTAEFPFNTTSLAGRLGLLLNESPTFGEDYNIKFGHDLFGTLQSFPVNARGQFDRVRFEREGMGELTQEAAEICARGIVRVINSVLLEYDFTPEPVDLAGVVNENIDIFNLWNKAEWTRHTQPADVISGIERGLWIVQGQEDALFRVVLNAVNNSRKAIEARYKLATIGKIEFGVRDKDGETVLDISDDGIGFSRHIDPDSILEPELPLTALVTDGRADSWFRQSGLGGTGHGLGIIQHLSGLMGAEVFIANPKLVDGSRLSIKFPQK